MSDKPIKDQIEYILYKTVDPTVKFQEGSLPAMTTMLYKVCDNDENKFNEAVRLVELFIKEALDTRS